MKKATLPKIVISLYFLVILSFLFTPVIFSESITLTTYYPSPYGVYTSIRLYPQNVNPSTGPFTCDSTTEGSLYYNSTDGQVYICSGGSWGSGWENVGWWRSNDGGVTIENTNSAAVNVQNALNVSGVASFSSCVNAATDIKAQGTVYGGGSGGSCDLAEAFPAAVGIEPGDVVSIDTEADTIKVKKSAIPYDQNFAGIVSESAAFYIGPVDQEDTVPLALSGRLLCKVTTEGGPIKKGDLLTTSSKAGYAMKVNFVSADSIKKNEDIKDVIDENNRRQSAIIGKALGNLDDGEGKIMVLVQ